MQPETSVVTITIRDGCLDKQASYLAAQTYRNFEWIIVDRFYEERKDLMADLARENGLHVIHLPETFPEYRCDSNVSSNANKSLCYSSGPHIVSLEDWHVIPPNYLEEHLNILKLGCAMLARWRRVRYINPASYQEFMEHCDIYEEDPRYGALGRSGINVEEEMKNGKIFISEWNQWWPSSSSAPARFMIDLCGGYDERLNGGTGGNDSELSYRMRGAGLKYIYNPAVDIYHISHAGGEIKSGPLPYEVCSHPRGSFTRNAYHPGGKELSDESDSLNVFYDDGVRYFNCKTCDSHGIIDSQEVLSRTMSVGNLKPPALAAGFPRNRLLEERKALFDSGFSHASLCALCKD